MFSCHPCCAPSWGRIWSCLNNILPQPKKIDCYRLYQPNFANLPYQIPYNCIGSMHYHKMPLTKSIERKSNECFHVIRRSMLPQKLCELPRFSPRLLIFPLLRDHLILFSWDSSATDANMCKCRLPPIPFPISYSATLIHNNNLNLNVFFMMLLYFAHDK